MKHTHKYRRVRMGKDKNYIVFKCYLDCSHYLAPELVIGRRSICWACENEFIMTKNTLKMKPTCGCTKVIEEALEESTSDKILERLGIIKEITE